MITCPRCGRENAADARFCQNCGNSLVTRVSVQERRVVTALFADLVRSTGMGESLDPEVVRGIVSRFFELAAREVAARGGTVEKFSGDAVMAVFGIPTAHEDDPERAVRAALAIRDSLADSMRVRIGIESGEVVVGDPFGGATMATGDAMNVAARLEQAAQPGEIIIGPAAHDALRTLVEADPLGELALRGHEAAVPGWRVRSISAEVGRPRGVPGLEAPLTGRDEELAALLNAADRAKRERKAVLFTIFGVPGVGKSRLTREATQRLTADGWQVVKGRCLPYGDGITYWPVVEMLRELKQDSADNVQALLGGAADAGATAQDIAHAFRRLIERICAETSLVLIFEDIHWAEPPLLDLIEYLATWTRDAPVLIVCPSRPELLDTRPAWGSGRMEASRISLEPLTEEESRTLLGALLTVEDLPQALRQRVLDRAEGNPLYVEEVVRMLIEEGVVERRDGHWFATQAAANVRVPDSIEALIRARLDTLPSPERVVLQAASVVGRIFQQSAVVSITPPDQVPPPLEPHLEDAILRDIITDERSPDEPTFRFRHILIRDVAYATLPKARRAELHVAVAKWLGEWVGARKDEFVEIEAYHLEQAVKLRSEVGESIDPAEREAAAAALLASAAKAATRADVRAQRTFAERGLALEPGGTDVRLDLAWHLGESHFRLGEYNRAAELAAKLEVNAAAAGRTDLEARAKWAKATASWISPEGSSATEALAEMRRARDMLLATEDWRYLTLTLESLGYEGWWFGDMEKAAIGWTEMVRVARDHGLVDLEVEGVMHLGQVAAMQGNSEERRRRLKEAQAIAERGGSRATRARIKRQLGHLTAMHDSGEEGRQLMIEAAAVLDELGDTEELATAYMFIGDSLFREANLELAIDFYRRSLALILEHMGYRPEVERKIATALLESGDIDAAEAIAEQAISNTAEDDWATVSSTRMVLGLVRAEQGRMAEAEELLRSAVALLEGKQFQSFEEHLRLAQFLSRVGQHEDARKALARFRAETESFAPTSPFLIYAGKIVAEIEAESGAA